MPGWVMGGLSMRQGISVEVSEGDRVQATGACPGYRKDHIVPLSCGGPDTVQNLQWQTIADAKAKDKWERKPCARR
jgi:hypothetical protein